MLGLRMLDELTESLTVKPLNGNSKPAPPPRDFSKLKVVYLCTAGEDQDQCIKFKPNSMGKCTFQDLSINHPLCREGKN